MWLVVYFYYPETKNIPMEEMGRLFGDEVAGTLEDELKHHGHAAHEKAAQATELEVGYFYLFRHSSIRISS